MGWDGQNIKKLAKDKGLSLIKLAKEIGVSRQAVNDWSKGQAPKGEYLISLCRILEVSPNSFFDQALEGAISVPVHRTRKTAKVNPEMQEGSVELAKEYELLFRNAPTTELLPVLRVMERNEENAKMIAEKLRKQAGIENHAPLDYKHTFDLLAKLGIIVIFRQFPEKVKSYAFYTKIHGHRVVFVNNPTNLLDLIFPILHEAVHAIRDEEFPDGAYDKKEEDFCDAIASHVQFPSEYIALVHKAIRGLKKGLQVNKLKGFGKRNSHSLVGIVECIKSIKPRFKLDIYASDTNLKKGFPSIGDVLFKTEEPCDYVKNISRLSPKFVEIVASQTENFTERKVGNLLGLESPLDAKVTSEELLKYRVKALD